MTEHQTPTEVLDFRGHDIFLIPSRNNSVLLYAPTLRKLLRITARLAARISEEGLPKEPAYPGIRGVANLLESALSTDAIQPFQLSHRPSRYFHLALGLTRNCTLQCLYCHADAGQAEAMPQNVVEKAVQYAFDSARTNHLKGINVSFAVGGEPTSDWEAFTFCIHLIKEKETEYKIPARLSMTTNGYYGQRRREFIAEKFYSVLLSLDGSPEIQNLHRPTRTGTESYSLCSETARFFAKAVESFSIRSTVSDKSVAKMPEIVRFFHAEFGNQYDLVFEPLVPLGRAIFNQVQLKEPGQEEFVTNYIAARELGSTLGLAVRTSAANHKRLVTSFCGAMSIPSFTVTTKGVVTTCERDSEGTSYAYGEFSPQLDAFVLHEDCMRRNAVQHMPEECHRCFCKWHCAGDCPDVRNIGYNRCFVNRSLMLYELETILNTGAT